jgi:hypothetical protein
VFGGLVDGGLLLYHLAVDERLLADDWQEEMRDGTFGEEQIMISNNCLLVGCYKVGIIISEL